MSSQIIRTTSHRRRSSVDIISAGDTQYVTCAPIVYLEATINGNLTGHPVEWVQLSGTPTVTLEPGGTPLQTFYMVNGNSGSDKVFRCYVDRNTQIEQYRDVTIRTTPRSSMNHIEHGVISNIVPLPNGAFSGAFIPVADFPFTIIPFAADGQLVVNQVSLTWSPPQFAVQADSIERSRYLQAYGGAVIQSWNGTIWIDIATYSASDTRAYHLLSDARLRQGNRFDFATGTVYAFNPWSDVSLASAGTLLVGKEVMALTEHGILGNTVVATRLVYVLDLRTYNSDLTSIDTGILTNVVSAVRIVYTLEQLPVSTDMASIDHGILNNTIAITRISGGVIGG